MHTERIRLFGRMVELSSRRAKEFLAGQNLFRELIRLGSDIQMCQEPAKALDLSNELEARSLFYQIVVISDSLKISRRLWKFWNWNLYRKFEQSYIKNHLTVSEMNEISEIIGRLEGNKSLADGSLDDLPADYIPLEPVRVKGFIAKFAGVPFEKIDELFIEDFFDSLKFAGEMLKVTVEGGKVNLTKEDEMAYHFRMVHKLKAQGKLGKKNGKVVVDA